LAAQPLTLKPGEVPSLLVKLVPGADPEAVAASIQERVPGSSVITSNHMARRIDDQLSGTVGSLHLTAGAVTLVSVPLIATVSTMVANERKREVGLLRAMGASKRFVFSAILAEALILASLGAAVGTVATGFLITVFKDLITTSLEIPFLWPSLADLSVQVGSVAVLAIAFGGLAALYPAIRSSRLDPYEAIRSGQS
jgi:putative ABC transport system permease protein